ncbi:MAG: CaiB/BaiF CoA-transferase family protein [Saprospiraceae bacterium]
MINTLFKDLKVVEFAGVLAGPSVGMFLAELGAQVVKVEAKNGGDVTRHWFVPGEDTSKAVSAYYASINWGKEVVFLDLKDESDLQKAQELALGADIVISNFNEKRALKYGLDYATLKKGNPGIVYASLTGFGKEDPRPAFDVVLQAEAGFLYMCGEPGGNPVKMPVALIDVLAAHQMKEGILVALLERERTGEGSLVEVSLFESAVASLVNQASNYLNAGHIPQKMGMQHPNIAPYGDYFKTADGKLVVLAVGSDQQFSCLMDFLKIRKEDYATFKSNLQRVANREKLNAFLEKELLKYDLATLKEGFLKMNIPFGEIKDMKSVFENPLANQMILEEHHEDGSISKRVKSVVFTIED